ncbi:hypothetical protein [Alcaligenes sp. WGS1538]|uniref:hypothetical protein n=1 Tax=Alcaligenes sp. WGS1538 TaxID=3366811 RepID=UPI00372CF823
MSSINIQAQACVACEGKPSPENTPCAVCDAGQPAANAEPVAWFIDWPDEPDLGHYLAESPVDGARSRALVFHDTAPVAAQAQQKKIKALESEVSGLRAARIAYASEFPPDAEGDPDVGNIHANIRKLKAQAQQDANMIYCGCGDLYPANSYGAGFIAAAGHCENCDAAQDRGTDKVDAALLNALLALVAYAEWNTCIHEDTHRGGGIWEICNDCGAKWADDEGGKPAFEWPQEIRIARALIDAACKETGR